MTRLADQTLSRVSHHGCSHRSFIRQYSASLCTVLHRALAGYLPDADAPLAFVSYSLVVLWYALYGQHSKGAKATTLPWYTQKAGVCFSDMLAALRRASWRERLFDPGASVSDLRKRLRPLVDYVATAA